ncbi:hypothetical protein [Candidatus Nitrosocosmicus sp. FF01]|uniref:hypothetical protein n=1 Tax=Candidatus Nitrosocosmicus sp. FF01 TaxID=3397670 RepID=UPI0039EBBE7B
MSSNKNQKIKKTKSSIQLSFLSSPRAQASLQSLNVRDNMGELVANLSDLKEWFEGFKIDSIELYVEGVITTGVITKLLVSFEGKGGCKITIKPE